MIHTKQAPSGTLEDLSDGAEAKRRAGRRILSSLRAHGYRRAEVPMYEAFDLYAKIYGEEIRRHLITFDTDQEYALRPDLTAGICRSVASMLLEAPATPLRFASMGSSFRYERVRPLRLREFTQVGLERIGDTPETLSGADLEILSLARLALAEVGVGGGVLRVGHAEVRERFLEVLGPPSPTRDKVDACLDVLARLRERLEPPGTGSDRVLDPSSGERTRVDPLQHEDLRAFLDEMRRKLPRKGSAAALLLSPGCSPEEIMETLEGEISGYARALGLEGPQVEALLRLSWPAASLGELADSLEPLLGGAREVLEGALGHIESCVEDLEPLVIHFSVAAARWGGFYTGFYFEVDLPVLGPDVSQVLGGGRYDGVMKALGAPETGACGFGIGLERLLHAAELLQGRRALLRRLSPPGPLLICFTEGENSAERAANLAENLGRKGCAFAYHPEPVTEEHEKGGLTDDFMQKLASLPGKPYRHAVLVSKELYLAHLENGSSFPTDLQTLYTTFER